MAQKHIVKSFDEQLSSLRRTIVEMGGEAERQIGACIDCVRRRDATMAGAVVEADYRLDLLEKEIDQAAIRLLALRQPMATDLREMERNPDVGRRLMAVLDEGRVAEEGTHDELLTRRGLYRRLHDARGAHLQPVRRRGPRGRPRHTANSAQCADHRAAQRRLRRGGDGRPAHHRRCVRGDRQ